jgi:hypothetical protein
MRKTFLIAICLAVGLGVGFAVGYAVQLAITVSNTPLMPGSYTGHDGLTNTFMAVGQLGAAENAAGACGSEGSRFFAIEDYAIQALQGKAAEAGLRPALDVARARLATRQAIAAEKQNNTALKVRYEEATEQFLIRSGWKDASFSHMRQIITQLDTDGRVCTPTPTKGRGA